MSTFREIKIQQIKQTRITCRAT